MVNKLLTAALLLVTLLNTVGGVCKTVALTEAEKAALDAHNELRAKHEGTEPLCYGVSGEDVQFTAQDWTNTQAENKQMKHSSGKYGENLAMAGRSPAPAVEITPAYIASAKAWYKEIEFWDFEKNTGNGNGETGHFTQLVWKNSKQVRCGYATYEDDFNNYIVTCQYYPPGNFNNDYANNVGQLKSTDEKKTCKRPDVANAQLKPETATLQAGGKYVVYCEEGYKLTGTVNMFTCGEDGKLSPASITCGKPTDKKTCNRPDVANAHMKPETATVQAGEKYWVSCKEGYKLTGTVNTFTCGEDGKLSPASITCEKPTDKKTCNRPDVANAHLKPETATLQAGGKYVVYCKEGYKLKGEVNTFTCGEDGKLSPASITCEKPTNKKTCKRPDVKNANLKPETATVQAGEKYWVSCEEGYKLKGEVNTFTCGEDGKLSPASITCEKPTNKKTCKRPDVKNANLKPDTATVQAGEKYMVSCEEGYKLKGEVNKFTCGEDGKLSPASITCEGQLSGVGKIALSSMLMAVVAVLFY